MRAASLRTWLGYLQQTDRLAVVDREVSLKFELAAVAKHFDGKKAVLFRNVGGSAIPVVAGVTTTRRMFAEACETTEQELVDKFVQAMANRLPCRQVDRAAAPVKAHVQREGIDLGCLFPIPVHHEQDAGNYITAGLFIVRDPQTGKQNVSIHRLQVSGPDRLGALILPRHTHHLHRQAEATGRPLDCAIVIGADPVTVLASQANVPFGVDELEIAGALRGEPLPVVRGETVDVDVPAEAEIVIEGKLLPGVREPEGPFGEFARYYGPRSDKEVVQVTAVTHRENPIYQTIIPAGYEHLLLGGIPREANLFQMVRQTVPSVKAVHLPVGGTCRYHAVVSLRKQVEGQGKNAILAAFASNIDVKHVFVVDEDVDIFDPEEVEWALATRFQADRGLVAIHGTQGASLDPSNEAGRGSKLGFDCTVPLAADPGRFLRIRIPGYDDVDPAAYPNPAARVDLGR